MSQGADGSHPPPAAWQPLTFGGVAAFASAGLGRLLLVGFVAAVIFGAGLVWFLQRDYCPVVLQAIQKMPETARVAGGKLQGVPDTVIAESRFLAIAVTPETAADIGQGADVQFQLRQTDFCIGSIFRPDWGLQFDYDAGGALKLGRSNLEPWWGAWRPVLLTGAGVGAVVLLLVAWALLASIYAAPAKFVAWFADRELSWSGAGRLCFAAMAPGALVMTFAVILYGGQAIDLVQLSFFWLAQLVMGWVYVVGGACVSPRLFPRATLKNPFASSS
jgi:hypothetical protein